MLTERSALGLQVILVVFCPDRLVTALGAVDQLVSKNGHGDTTWSLCVLLEMWTLAAGTI